MKNVVYLILLSVLLSVSSAYRPVPSKLVSKNAHISFFSHTPVEDISANNYKVLTTLETTTGEIAFSVPMQSFEFEKALMQEHFNSKDFLNTKAFPKAKFTGKITNINTVDFSKDGSYEVTVQGELTLKDTTKPVQSVGTLTIKGNVVTAQAKLKIVLADYGIAFKKGKPSTNIAKEIETTIKAEYLPE